MSIEKSLVIELPEGPLVKNEQIFEEIFQGKVSNGILEFDNSFGKGKIVHHTLDKGLEVTFFSVNFKRAISLKRTEQDAEDSLKVVVLLPSDSDQVVSTKGTFYRSGVLLTYSGLDHFINIPKGECTWFTYYYSIDKLRKGVQNDATRTWLKFIDEHPYALLFEQIKSPIENLIKEFLDYLDDNRMLFRLMQKSLSVQIFILIAKYFNDRIKDDNDIKPINSTDLHSLFKVKAKLENSIMDGAPSISHLAEEVNMSPRKLQRIFNQTFGTSPSLYFQSYRMEEALRLIRKKKYNLTEIAFMLGFSSLGHFSSMFKKYHKITPKQYEQLNID
ncbi:helix-turn-helix domain-containing protein [Sediminitomix flava]|uniref:Helix-turn-helix protein n=1 Tax=Sediminitomix flava TaxID=379075 RepID=A0A315ZGR3_SEDFL|nr:helix-turn-helix transcriptional regulator [Sediminitomix flava]PWJ44776.1 helix-turn-helix protein [Sediminitomix flava]